MGENSFLESFAQIMFNQDVYGGLNSPRPENWAIYTTRRGYMG